jgi:integrase/recombinase XerD
MSSLTKALYNYLEIRRELGFSLLNVEKFLRNFVNFLESRNATYITVELALQWATFPKDAQPSQWGHRLNIVRRFAEFQHTIDSRNEVPPKRLLPFHYKRKMPHVYSPLEIISVLKATQNLKGKRGLRSRTHYTIFGLLAVTGMRISEAINLDDTAVNLSEGILTIHKTKFGKTRLVPIHGSVQRELESYKAFRDSAYPNPVSPSFFIGELGKRLTDSGVRGNFATCSCLAGLREPAKSYGHGPRIHDLRHTFAVKTLIRWYREGKDVERELPKLSTYLGHNKPSHTYWYLTAVPELMQYAVARINNEQ